MLRIEIKTRVKTKFGEVPRSYFVKAKNPAEAECKFRGKLDKGWKPKGVKSVFVKSVALAYGKGVKPVAGTVSGSL